MDFVRIGDKVISRDRIYSVVNRILELRANGLSQQDVAEALGVDRTLVSRLETVGEIRKGGKVALIGFPVKNKAEIEVVAREEGADFVLLMTEAERWDFVGSKNGISLLNEVMALISQARDCDTVIFLGSDLRVKLMEAIIGRSVLGVEIGCSPISEDKYVDPALIRRALQSVKQ